MLFLPATSWRFRGGGPEAGFVDSGNASGRGWGLSYSIHRSGMELLYLPIPAQTRNAVKGFIDLFVDRAGTSCGCNTSPVVYSGSWSFDSGVEHGRLRVNSCLG